MKHPIRKFLVLAITVCVGLSILTGTVSAQTIDSAYSNDKLKQLDKITSEHGMTIKESKNSDNQEYAAKYDSIEDFEAALQAGKVGVSLATPEQKPAKSIESFSDAKETGFSMQLQKSSLLSGNATRIMPLSSANMTVFLVDGGLYDIKASMGYTYEMINGFKYYTGFTSFTPYFVGIHTGITFNLISWYGTPISDYWFEDDGQFIYVPASVARMYFYQWEGTVDTTVSIGGISYVISQYAWSYGFGGG